MNLVKHIQNRFWGTRDIMLFLFYFTVGLFVLPIGSFSNSVGGGQDIVKESGSSCKIQWLGHASYLLTSSKGTTILIDPVDFEGYSLPKSITADIVTVSHEHIDHNSVEAIDGSPFVFCGTDENCSTVNSFDTTINEVRLYSVSSFHDPGHYGVNAIFVFEFDNIRIAHLGDIGTILTNSQIDAIREVDILMIPVGGQFTISAPEADTIVEQLNVKRAVFPMHYKTEAFDILPYTAEPFLKDKEDIIRIDDNTFILDISKPEIKREYIVLQY